MQLKKHLADRQIINLLHDRTIVYLILVLLLYLSLGEMYHNIHTSYINVWGIKMRRLGDAMLFALPLLLMKKKYLIFVYLILVNAYFLSIVWYYRVYCTIMPLTSYLMVYNLDGLLPSILRLIKIKDLFIVLPFAVFGIFYCYICKEIKWSIFSRGKTLIFSILVLGGIVLPNAFKRSEPNNCKTLNTYFALEPLRTFKEYGIIHFWIYQFGVRRGVSDVEKEYARCFMQDVGNGNNCAKPKIEESKNLILILVESLQSWPIGMKIDGIEVTPHINHLLDLNMTVHFLKEMPQVRDGRSSDAQLIINTGLLPLTTGAASSLCATNVFYSLPEALGKKGYTTASFLCDDKYFWNQEATSLAYHFDKLYDHLWSDGGVEQADEQLFARVLPLLEQLQQPFYAQVVTLSSHHPFIKPNVVTPLDKVNIANTEAKDYLIVLHYVDQCIGDFLEQLKEKGLYDNSVIVITGDHEALPFNQYEGRKEMSGEDCFVPFIILNSSLPSKHTDKVIGQIDIYPSLLDLMGCSNYSFTGLGESVFSDEISNYAMYQAMGLSSGGMNVSDSVKRHREECWKVSDILLRMNYFKE